MTIQEYIEQKNDFQVMARDIMEILENNRNGFLDVTAEQIIELFRNDMETADEPAPEKTTELMPWHDED